jgi:hypothetical protein
MKVCLLCKMPVGKDSDTERRVLELKKLGLLKEEDHICEICMPELIRQLARIKV